MIGTEIRIGPFGSAWGHKFSSPIGFVRSLRVRPFPLFVHDRPKRSDRLCSSGPVWIFEKMSRDRFPLGPFNQKLSAIGAP